MLTLSFRLSQGEIEQLTVSSDPWSASEQCSSSSTSFYHNDNKGEDDFGEGASNDDFDIQEEEAQDRTESKESPSRYQCLRERLSGPKLFMSSLWAVKTGFIALRLPSFIVYFVLCSEPPSSADAKDYLDEEYVDLDWTEEKTDKHEVVAKKGHGKMRQSRTYGESSGDWESGSEGRRRQPQREDDEDDDEGGDDDDDRGAQELEEATKDGSGDGPGGYGGDSAIYTYGRCLFIGIKVVSLSDVEWSTWGTCSGVSATLAATVNGEGLCGEREVEGRQFRTLRCLEDAVADCEEAGVERVESRPCRVVVKGPPCEKDNEENEEEEVVEVTQEDVWRTR